MKNKKIGAFVSAVALSLCLAVSGCAKSEEVGVEKNAIGHESISTISMVAPELFNDVNDFVIFNVGSHEAAKTSFLDKKLSVCSKAGIDYGLIITPSLLTEEGIYNDIDYLKGILSRHDVTMPVYFNIDPIINSDSLYVEMKTKLIKDFLIKCDSNHMYVGLYGTDTNLCRAKEYCGVGDYYDPDCFLVMDGPDIKYDGPCHIVKDTYGNIKSSFNIAASIKKANLNDPDRFERDGVQIVKNKAELTDIAFKYGYSVDELLGFNNIRSKSDVKPGTILRIPSVINNVAPNSEIRMQLADDYSFRGIDISQYQGDSDAMDWDALKRNCDFIIARVAIGERKDDQFEKNVSNASANGIFVGTYTFNGYTKDDVNSLDEFKNLQKRQVDNTIKLLSNLKIDYPVYLDIEPSDIENNLPSDYVNAMLDIWYDNLTSAGYTPGIYSGAHNSRYIASCVDYDLSSKFSMWLAGGPKYHSEDSSSPKYDVSELLPYEPNEYFTEPLPFNVDTIQVTNRCVNAGAGNHQGCVDYNFSKINSVIVVDEDSKILMKSDIKDFSNVINFDSIKEIAAAIIGTSIVGGALLLIVKRKVNTR